MIENLITDKRTKQRPLIMMFIVLLPMMNMYKAFSTFSIADVTIIVVFIYSILGRKKIVLSRKCRGLTGVAFAIIATWFIDTTLVQFVYGIDINLAKSFLSALRVALYYLFVGVVVPWIDWKCFLRIYRWVVWICACVLFVQTIVHAVTGRVLLGYFKFLPLLNSNIDSESLIRLNTYSMYRPYSVFTEPGMYVRYVLPYIAMLLFDTRNISCRLRIPEKKLLIEVAVLSVSCLLSKSGQGLAILALEIVLFILLQLKIGKIQKRYGILLLGVLAGAAYFVTTDTFLETLVRLFPAGAIEVRSDIAAASSFNVRILRGFIVYAALPLLLKLFGFGYGNQGAVLGHFDISTPYDQANTSGGYMNGAAYTLVNTGIFGFALFLLVFIRTMLDKRKNMVNRVMGLVALVLSFIGGTTISVLGILYFLFVLAYPDSAEEPKNRE